MSDEVMEPGNGAEEEAPAPDDVPAEPDNGEEEVANVVDAPENQPPEETVVYDSEAEAAKNDESPAADEGEEA